VRAVTGRAEVIRSGGRVLKNVTGLDLCKLLAGSHGTLGVITEVTLKVLPAPAATGTLVLLGLDAPAAVAALSAALGSPYGVSGAAWLPAGAALRLLGLRDPVALARIEEFPASVAYRLGRLRDQFALPGASILDTAGSRALWRAIRDAKPLEGEAVCGPRRGRRCWRRCGRWAFPASWTGAAGWCGWPGRPTPRPMRRWRLPPRPVSAPGR
jgi:glycolate oxidase FAD binding subunit